MSEKLLWLNENIGSFNYSPIFDSTIYINLENYQKVKIVLKVNNNISSRATEIVEIKVGESLKIDKKTYEKEFEVEKDCIKIGRTILKNNIEKNAYKMACYFIPIKIYGITEVEEEMEITKETYEKFEENRFKEYDKIVAAALGHMINLKEEDFNLLIFKPDSPIWCFDFYIAKMASELSNKTLKIRPFGIKQYLLAFWYKFKLRKQTKFKIIFDFNFKKDYKADDWIENIENYECDKIIEIVDEYYGGPLWKRG